MCVDITADEVTYTMRDYDSTAELVHAGETVTVTTGPPVIRAITPLEPPLPRPVQPSPAGGVDDTRKPRRERDRRHPEEPRTVDMTAIGDGVRKS